MKVCPKCGNIVSYNSYFGAYICDNCNWEDIVKTKRYVIMANNEFFKIKRHSSSKTRKPISIKLSMTK